jgi:sorting and assembly machinery component 37
VDVRIEHAYQPVCTGPEAELKKLPWKAPERVSVAAVGSTLLGTLADNTPFLREIRQNRRLKLAAQSDGDFSPVQKSLLAQYADSSNKDMLVSVFAAVAGTAALVGYMVSVGLLSFSGGPAEEEVDEEVEGDVVHLDPGSAADFLGAL